jgi:hypothetical protein
VIAPKDVIRVMQQPHDRDGRCQSDEPATIGPSFLRSVSHNTWLLFASLDASEAAGVAPHGD